MKCRTMKHRAIGLLFAILMFFAFFRASMAATVTPPTKAAPQMGPTISTPPAANVASPQTNVTPPSPNSPKLANPQSGLNVGIPPKATARIQCGFNDSTHRGECSCTGDVECNEMFTNYCKE